ncbi:SDR family NAD(P)-dependent oxidoreductase [Actinoplanes sp. TBRC 11911]|uniref:SDR family NAD(P)-dependent oxidoreductase n=1 Tax=Actinoplanes sp. TBRC 11911 TaxID=2729386 RepID=UPI00145CDE86|nr:SDR family NAD(P)-dependent oxidoreductase [Actinoplanes sp. TBRC 11911]NMO53997.1 SDR family NAD(P)-dependent oxidoreductase [Actinoplanes sp. TBRC 11911]
MPKNIVVSGASSGFGRMTSRALAEQGHTVFAGIRDVAGRNAEPADEAAAYARGRRVDLRVIELDVTSAESVKNATAGILDQGGRVDVLVHNVGAMVVGPAEAFTPEQLADLYDTNVLGAHRLNRAMLPSMRANGDGLLLWIGNAGARAGSPPYLAPYFAAKAGLDALAANTALEVARFGIETTIVTPGSFTRGTNHYAHAGAPADAAVAAEYELRYPQLMEQIGAKMAMLEPAGIDAAVIARLIVEVVAMDKGTRPLRVHHEPSGQGATAVDEVADRVRGEFLARLGLSDLLHPSNPEEN